jgi:hypothetical protein
MSLMVTPECVERKGKERKGREGRERNGKGRKERKGKKRKGKEFKNTVCKNSVFQGITFMKYVCDTECETERQMWRNQFLYTKELYFAIRYHQTTNKNFLPFRNIIKLRKTNEFQP